MSDLERALGKSVEEIHARNRNKGSEMQSFEAITEPGYIDLLRKRLHDSEPLTWIAQAARVVEHDQIQSVLDVGCATGYAAKTFTNMAYTGTDIEEQYLAIAREYFKYEQYTVKFLHHDLMATPLPHHSDLTLLNAVLEHCPALSPALDNLLESTKRIALFRLFMGEQTELRSVPAPKGGDARKHTNQYAFLDVFRVLDRHGFTGTIIRDEFTDSLPRYVNGALRTFYFVKALRL